MTWYTLPSPGITVFLFVAVTLAGFLDAIVGGGGMISLPSLMLGLNNLMPLQSIQATGKILASAGASTSAWKFFREDYRPVQKMWLPMLCASLSAVAGVRVSFLMDAKTLQPVMLFILFGLLLFTVFRPNLGREHTPRFATHHQMGILCTIATVLGFYDGFFGPGVGSILIFLFVSVLGFDFLRASAMAKYVNWASNVSSVVVYLCVFLWEGTMIPVVLALLLAVGNGLGGLLGVRFAIYRGSRVARWIFIGVVSALIVFLGVRVFHRPMPTDIVQIIISSSI